MDKKDLEELEDWKRKQMNYVETYGIDIFNPKEPNKILVKLLKVFEKVTKGVLILTIIFIVVGLFGGLIGYYSYVHSKLHINPTKTISKMYNKHVKVLSKNIDEYENGEYEFTIKENKEINFKAIVEWNQMKDDYSDRCQKYYFERWQGEQKNKVKTDEHYDSGLLRYAQYIEINSYDEIEEAINILYQFALSAGKMYFPDWDLHLMYNNVNIYPFFSLELNREEALKEARKQFLQIQGNQNKTNNTETDTMKDIMQFLF